MMPASRWRRLLHENIFINHLNVVNTLLPDGSENMTKYHSKDKPDAKDSKYTIAGVLIKEKHGDKDGDKDGYEKNLYLSYTRML
jgi:hypothetical protein